MKKTIKEGLIKDTYELIINEIQTVVTISYIIIVGIGMLFTFQKYSQFGINIFDYADVFDFLIAPFSDFKILLFSSITIIIVFSFFKLDSYWETKYPKSYSKMNLGLEKKSWFNLYRYSTFIILLIFYLFLFSDSYGKISAKQTKKQLPITLKYSDNEIVKGILIGKTKDIVFLFQNEKVIAIPITSSVKEFEIK